MFAVQFEDQGGRILSFQIPCKFAGCVGWFGTEGRELAIRRYLPYWKYKAASEGLRSRGKDFRRSSVGRVSGVPISNFTRPKYFSCPAM